MRDPGRLNVERSDLRAAIRAGARSYLAGAWLRYLPVLAGVLVLALVVVLVPDTGLIRPGAGHRLRAMDPDQLRALALASLGPARPLEAHQAMARGRGVAQRAGPEAPGRQGPPQVRSAVAPHPTSRRAG